MKEHHVQIPCYIRCAAWKHGSAHAGPSLSLLKTALQRSQLHRLGRSFQQMLLGRFSQGLLVMLAGSVRVNCVLVGIPKTLTVSTTGRRSHGDGGWYVPLANNELNLSVIPSYGLVRLVVDDVGGLIRRDSFGEGVQNGFDFGFLAGGGGDGYFELNGHGDYWSCDDVGDKLLNTLCEKWEAVNAWTCVGTRAGMAGALYTQLRLAWIDEDTSAAYPDGTRILRCQ